MIFSTIRLIIAARRVAPCCPLREWGASECTSPVGPGGDDKLLKVWDINYASNNITVYFRQLFQPYNVAILIKCLQCCMVWSHPGRTSGNKTHSVGKQTLLVSVKINTHLIYYRKETKCLFYSNGCTNFGNFLLILIHFMLWESQESQPFLKKKRKKLLNLISWWTDYVVILMLQSSSEISGWKTKGVKILKSKEFIFLSKYLEISFLTFRPVKNF